MVVMVILRRSQLDNKARTGSWEGLQQGDSRRQR